MNGIYGLNSLDMEKNKELLKKILEALGFEKILPDDDCTTELFEDSLYVFDLQLWIYFGGKGSCYVEKNNLKVEPAKYYSNTYMSYQSRLNGDLLDEIEFLSFFKEFYKGYVYDHVSVSYNI